MMFKIGDRVKALKPVGRKDVCDAIGTIICIKCFGEEETLLVEFDDNIDGHRGDSSTKTGKENHCWYVNNENLELITQPTPTPTVNINIGTININEVSYDNACWYCRKGGLVDLVFGGSIGVCPNCGRLCNTPTVLKITVDTVELTPSADNKPLTTEELKALKNGDRVFTVWLDADGNEQLKHTMTCWRTVDNGNLRRKQGNVGFESNGDSYHAYREIPEGAVDSGK